MRKSIFNLKIHFLPTLYIYVENNRRQCHQSVTQRVAGGIRWSRLIWAVFYDRIYTRCNYIIQKFSLFLFLSPFFSCPVHFINRLIDFIGIFESFVHVRFNVIMTNNFPNLRNDLVDLVKQKAAIAVSISLFDISSMFGYYVLYNMIIMFLKLTENNFLKNYVME